MADIVAKGIDISYAQGNINWPIVAKNVDFAMIRATLGYPSPGFTGVDRCWTANIAGAVNSGIPFGLYHYSYALTTDAAKKEAENFLNVIKGYKPLYPVAFDFEEPKQLALPTSTQMDIIDTFMKIMEQAGYYAVLYMSASPMLALMRAQKERMGFYDKWVAHIAASPAVSGGMWQYSWKGEIPGIRDDLPSGHKDKGVDLDYAYKNYPNLIKSNGKNGWAVQDKPATPIIETVPKSDYDALQVKYDGLQTKYNALINGMKALIGG